MMADASSLSPPVAPRDWLVLSDMHLGSDIAEGSSVVRRARSRSVDDDLIALLDHYRELHAEGAWHLVINGDFIDFIGMSIHVAGASLSTEPNDEERAHGLGSAEDHACAKLARVAERHRAVFAALARFVGAGHQLTIVPGNHDKEFHWGRVQEDFRAHLLASNTAPVSTSPGATAAFLGRIQFAPWFVWIEGVAYIEHGHQYDAYCATDETLLPQSPEDPRRLASGFSDVLLRFIVHHTRGLGQQGHDRMGVVDYLALALRLGIRGGIELGMRFVRAIAELFRLRRLALSEMAQALRVEHDRRVANLAQAMRIGHERLRALKLLQAPPVMRSVRGILASLLLDRVALGVLCGAMLVFIAVVGALTEGHVALAIGPVLPSWWLIDRHLSRTRNIDPQDELAARARPLAQLFPAAFIVMGHTHVPVRMPIDDGRTTYINAGSWAEEEGAPVDAPIAYRAARTHLVIKVSDRGPEAELLTWASGVGPKRFVVE
jgi:UDP-2,3-diacylglucosamine pyrophosphatase LpxH